MARPAGDFGLSFRGSLAHKDLVPWFTALVPSTSMALAGGSQPDIGCRAPCCGHLRLQHEAGTRPLSPALGSPVSPVRRMEPASRLPLRHWEVPQNLECSEAGLAGGGGLSICSLSRNPDTLLSLHSGQGPLCPCHPPLHLNECCPENDLHF